MGVLWDRDLETVAINLLVLQRIQIDTKGEGIFTRPFMSLGPVPLSDIVGMKPEVLLLQNYTNTGR